MNFDLYCVQLCSRLSLKYKWLKWPAIFLAKYLPYLMVAFLIFYFIFIGRYSALFIIFLSSFFARFFLNHLVYAFYPRKRPFREGLIQPFIKAPQTPSFPSGHTSFCFAFSFALLVYNIPLALIFIGLCCVMSLARIFCGVHWPSDILGGLIVGAISALVITQLCL